MKTRTAGSRVTGEKREEILGDWPEALVKEPGEEPAPKEPGLADTLRIVAAQAMELRRAGVVRVSVDKVGFELLPYIEPQAGRESQEPEDDGDINSPALYAGGRVPRLPRPPRRNEEYDDGQDA